MASSLQTLIKILQLEQEKGHQNKAVIGGFARFAFHWAREAHAQARTDEHHVLVDEIAQQLRAYEAAAEAERPALLEGIIALAKGQVPVTAPAHQTLPAGQPAAPEVDESSPAPPAPDDVGIGQVDEHEEDHSPQADAQAPADVFEVYGTFEHEPLEAGVRPVRERRGYARQQTAPAPPEVLAGLDAPVSTVSGVGDSRAELLERLGVSTVRDLLNLFPRRYDDYSRMKPINRLKPGEVVTVIGVVDRIQIATTQRGGKRVEAYLDDGSDHLRLNWFNQPWMAKQLESGEPYVVSGKVDQYLGRLVINSPEVEPVERESLHAGRIVPIYRLTEGLSERVLRRIMHDAVNEWAPRLPDPLPLEVRENADLMDRGDAVAQAHFPDTWEDMEAALHRLAFDELLILHLAMLQRRRQWQSRQGAPLAVADEWIETFVSHLPYELTAAQRRAVADIRQDMASDLPMNRLLQGDVGSGKTVVATIAAGIAVATGTQAAIMAPTSILAEQHYASLSTLLDTEQVGRPVNVALLTGNLSQLEREGVYAGLAEGSIDVVVGTHALIQPGVAFHNLGLAVIDEQHRFGVAQRGALREKASGGGNPHLLVMTATPIPRTLALTLHADLDLTVIDEMPPGRIPVQTRILQPKERERAFAFIRGQVEKGHQAYVIYPLVEDSDKLDVRSAVAEHERLQRDVFPDLRVGLIHGQLSGDEKDGVMAAFYRGEIDILVSTTVIEVGIDVPSATVMLVENATRFGLAQLHQLRGRVGRGGDQGYCLLISDSPFLDGDERLRAVEETTDGFRLAEIDWKLRGAGDLLGTRQSGYGHLDFARLMDPRLVDLVQREARALVEQDPDLAAPEHGLLAERVSAVAVETGDVS